ncbi:Ig-like domain-containing protein [Microbacterium sp. PMB16]|uniref:Ig-like domain-containing protein n=1 Tax=Microbacterium sp. PMB16 TaxID=3120157 RepID=UPI003F4BCDBE
MYFIGDDGRVTFTPVPTFRGEATPVVYEVADSLGNSAASTVTITVAGVDPIARNNSATTAPGVPVTIDVIGDDSAGTGGAPLDPDSVRIVDADGDLVTELVVAGEGVWTVVDGKIVFTPERGFSGTTTPITYSVADENGTRVTATVTVTVAAGEIPPTTPPGGALPTTGGLLPWLPLGGGLLLLLAGAMLVIRRRSA